MNQTNQIQKLTREYSGDYGLLPVEIWDIIYDMKYALEKSEIDKCKKNISDCEKKDYELKYKLFSQIHGNMNKNPNFGSIKTWIIMNHIDITDLLHFNFGHREEEETMHKTLTQKRPRKNNIKLFEDIWAEELHNVVRKIDNYYIDNMFGHMSAWIENVFYDWFKSKDMELSKKFEPLFDKNNALFEKYDKQKIKYENVINNIGVMKSQIF